MGKQWAKDFKKREKQLLKKHPSLDLGAVYTHGRILSKIREEWTDDIWEFMIYYSENSV